MCCPWPARRLAGGCQVGGKKYDVEILDRDSQSDPQRSAQVANDLINSDKVDLMLTTSTPETVNPVSDACEAAGVPCLSTVMPWEAWYFGRGAKPGDQQRRSSGRYHFCFGVEQFHQRLHRTCGRRCATNKKVGVMWPNDADGNAIRDALGPLLKKDGYTIVDPGAYTDGTNDYSAQIAKFKAENCEIFNTFPIPPDFATFWRQAAQQGYKPKIAQIAKTGLFPSQVEALGDIGVNLASAAYWTPTFPYKSSLTEVTARQLADGYENDGRQAVEPAARREPRAVRRGGRRAQGRVQPEGQGRRSPRRSARWTCRHPIGQPAVGQGPDANVVATPIIGGQWVEATAGSKYKLDFVLCENSTDPNVPVAAKLKVYGS